MSPVVYNRFGKIAAEMEAKARAILLKTALDAQALAMQNSRVDTGAMREGWHLTPGRDRFEIRIANTQAYAVYHEYGFHTRDGREVFPQPMIHPALDAVRGPFEMALRGVL